MAGEQGGRGSVRSVGSGQAGSGDPLASFSVGFGAVWGISAGTWSWILTPVYVEFKNVSSSIYILPHDVMACSLIKHRTILHLILTFTFLDVSSELSAEVRLTPPVSSDSSYGNVCILLLSGW